VNPLSLPEDAQEFHRLDKLVKAFKPVADAHEDLRKRFQALHDTSTTGAIEAFPPTTISDGVYVGSGAAELPQLRWRPYLAWAVLRVCHLGLGKLGSQPLTEFFETFYLLETTRYARPKSNLRCGGSVASSTRWFRVRRSIDVGPPWKQS
jgi:hypothetical protein